MNLLLISFEFPPEPGGIGNYSFHIADQLARFGHDVTTVIAYKKLGEKEFLDFRKKQKFKLIYFKQYNHKFLKILLSINFFKSIIKKNRIQLIISTYHKAGIIGWIFKKVYGIPYLMVGHGSEFLPLNLLHDTMIKLVFNGCNQIIANSEYTKSLIRKAGIRNKNISVIYPGADDTLYDFNKQRKRSGNKAILLSVGALSLRKGHKYVIQAMQLLKESNPEIEYWIVGKGREADNLHNQIQSDGLEKCVKLIGFVPDDMLKDYYKNADIFILNSTTDDPTQVEGFGIVLIEANLMGLPVIASNTGGIKEAVEEGTSGMLVNPKDPRQIAESIKTLIQNNLFYEKLSIEGYRRAKSCFTWKKSAEKLNDLLSRYN